MALPHHVEPMFSAQHIEQRLRELAAQVAKDYQDKEIVLVGILHGGALVLSDFARELWNAGMTTTVYKDYIGISSYGSETKSGGKTKLTKKLKNSIKGRHVLIVEDIVDTGRSLETAIAQIKKDKPLSIKTLALMSKKERREVEVPLEYVGFEIPDTFVVGYDLDYDEMYRTMPYIGRVVFD